MSLEFQYTLKRKNHNIVPDKTTSAFFVVPDSTHLPARPAGSSLARGTEDAVDTDPILIQVNRFATDQAVVSVELDRFSENSATILSNFPFLSSSKISLFNNLGAALSTLDCVVFSKNFQAKSVSVHFVYVTLGVEDVSRVSLNLIRNTPSSEDDQVSQEVGVPIESDMEKLARVIVESIIDSDIVILSASICPSVSISIVSTELTVGGVESIINVSPN